MVLVTDKEFYMDGYLKKNMDIAIRNIHKDLDFIIPISGSGNVRIGKSCIAQQLGYYITYEVNRLYCGKNAVIKDKNTGKPLLDKPNTFNVKDNFCYDGEELIKKGNELGKKKFNVLIYDEAGSDLVGRKTFQRITQNLLDFLRECGMYNLFIFVVLPEFFELPRGVATNRSIFLLDVYFTEEFERGQFKFFSGKSKKKLYQYGKKDLDYNVVKPDFRGRFLDQWLIDKNEYKKAKRDALVKRGNPTRMDIKFLTQRNVAWYILNRQLGYSPEKILDLYEVNGFKLNLDPGTVQRAIELTAELRYKEMEKSIIFDELRVTKNEKNLKNQEVGMVAHIPIINLPDDVMKRNPLSPPIINATPIEEIKDLDGEMK